MDIRSVDIRSADIRSVIKWILGQWILRSVNPNINLPVSIDLISTDLKST